VRTVARRTGNNEDEVFRTVKHSIIRFFRNDMEQQALMHTRHRIRNGIEFRIDIRVFTIEEFADHIASLTEEIDPYITYNKLMDKFKRFVSDENYPAILKFFNQKAMITQSRITQMCGFTSTDKYICFVISILRENKKDAEIIRNAVKACFNIAEETPKLSANK
ncbi:MAG: ABC transporter ATP-binding protein, partial [Bacteroidales bacterium]